ncbi:MAG: segregation/condensation protein A, partial [Dehalococcoidia bacterium]
MIELRLPGYQGPLDLLLQLIEKHELDISEVSLVQVTDQYLEQVESLRAGAGDRLADSLAEFLAIGGKLMLLKSKTLLPREIEPLYPEAEEDDVGRELVEMLEEYRRYRDAVTVLGTIDRSGL